VCDEGRYELLEAEQGSTATSLCGRSAVQISPRPARDLDLAALGRRLEGLGPLSVNEYLLRLEVDGYQLTVFPDGRTIVKGSADPAVARTLYARYVGA
jgi:adenylyltransferase/sulfurtransferase